MLHYELGEAMSENHSFPPNSPSEIFKLRAKQFSLLITEISGFRNIPSKKRYDWLAHALGYKDYSDLLHSNYLRRTTDNRSPLNIFNNKKQREKIITVFYSNLPNVSKKDIGDATRLMAIIENPESIALLFSLIRSGIRLSSINKLIKPKHNKVVTYKLKIPKTTSEHLRPLHRAIYKKYLYSFSEFREDYIQMMLSENFTNKK